MELFIEPIKLPAVDILYVPSFLYGETLGEVTNCVRPKPAVANASPGKDPED